MFRQLASLTDVNLQEPQLCKQRHVFGHTLSNIMSDIFPIPKTTKTVTRIAVIILFISKEFIYNINYYSYNMLVVKKLKYLIDTICVSWTHKLSSNIMSKTVILIPSRLSATRLPR